MLVIWAKAITHASSCSCGQLGSNYSLPLSEPCASLLWESDSVFQKSVTQIFKQEMYQHAQENITRLPLCIFRPTLKAILRSEFPSLGTLDVIDSQPINK